ncbi:integral membrane plasmid transfer protein [Streptomyces inusitatus]|uniref:Integral membrane plasmid transfer protein n=1 Tax=Streptomyces inusitatus TaxID=68221 RepID=A0A918UYY4_9ACTN|nr:Pycsar system effector family protein [Streptomyces inusitatus]GGZ44744.1 integral membrane plasmid transfer protein [Streptomyces inusitatus]
MNTPDSSGLMAAHAEVKAEIARTDTKTGLLLAFIGAVIAVVGTLAKDVHPHIPTAAYMVGGIGVAVLIGAAGMLLRAVRPNLGGRAPVGFPRWATLTPDEIRAELAQDRRAEHIAALSRIAVAKYVRLRRAVDLTCVGGVLLIAAAVITVVGSVA